MRCWRLLFLIPLIPVVWTPLSDHIDPRLWGMPFVIWFQFIVVLLGMAVTAAVHLIENSQDRVGASKPAHRWLSRPTSPHSE